MRQSWVVKWGFLFFLVALALSVGGCSNPKNNNPTGPVTVTIVPTPLPIGVAGKDWNYTTLNASFSGRYGQSALVYNNAMWIIGGVSGTGSDYNDVWSSTDGKNWTQVLGNNASPGPNQFSQRQLFAAAVFNNKMWVVGGESATSELNDVWSSTDGVNWTNVLPYSASPGPAQFPGRFLHNVLAYNGSLYVIAGDIGGNPVNDVWSSSDGVTWTQLLSNTASPGSNQFSQRDFAGVGVFNNAMWVIAGGNASTDFNDTWTSTNGSSWTNKIANNASPGTLQFSQRAEPSVLTYGNTLWVIGGESNAGPDLNDVWYSADGTYWTQMTASANFSARFSQSGLVFNNAMWIIAGLNGSYLNDVWYSPY
jgi:hypothetical protein